MNLANNIKRVAKEHGKTITQVAKSLGVLQPQLSRTINNPRISLEDLNKLAETIGCQTGDFFSSEEETVITVSSKVKTIKIKIEDEEDLTDGQTPREATNPNRSDATLIKSK